MEILQTFVAFSEYMNFNQSHVFQHKWVLSFYSKFFQEFFKYFAAVCFYDKIPIGTIETYQKSAIIWAIHLILINFLFCIA